MAAVIADVEVACDAEGIPSTDSIREWIGATIRGAGCAPDAEAEIAVRVVGPEEMQALNRRFRRQDKVTNVLSFEAAEIEGLPADAPRVLGDVVICAPVVATEARDQAKRLEDHWAHMLVHGTLHLLGYDHLTESGAEEMEALEIQILAAGDVADPYRRS